jgi:hypothetical protein
MSFLLLFRVLSSPIGPHQRINVRRSIEYFLQSYYSNFQASLKKPAVLTLPGKRALGAMFKSITA